MYIYIYIHCFCLMCWVRMCDSQPHLVECQKIYSRAPSDGAPLWWSYLNQPSNSSCIILEPTWLQDWCKKHTHVNIMDQLDQLQFNYIFVVEQSKVKSIVSQSIHTGLWFGTCFTCSSLSTLSSQFWRTHITLNHQAQHRNPSELCCWNHL